MDYVTQMRDFALPYVWPLTKQTEGGIAVFLCLLVIGGVYFVIERMHRRPGENKPVKTQKQLAFEMLQADIIADAYEFAVYKKRLTQRQADKVMQHIGHCCGYWDLVRKHRPDPALTSAQLKLVIVERTGDTPPDPIKFPDKKERKKPNRLQRARMGLAK